MIPLIERLERFCHFPAQATRLNHLNLVAKAHQPPFELLRMEHPGAQLNLPVGQVGEGLILCECGFLEMLRSVGIEPGDELDALAFCIKKASLLDVAIQLEAGAGLFRASLTPCMPSTSPRSFCACRCSSGRCSVQARR